VSDDPSRTATLRFDRHAIEVHFEDEPFADAFVRVAGPLVAERAGGELVGRFRVSRSGGGLTLDSGSERLRCPDDAIALRELLHAAAQKIVEARGDLLWLHAGVVARSGRAVLLCGASGQGKSTVAGRLVESGWTYYSDEIAPVDATTCRVLAFPLPPYRRVHTGEWISDAHEVQALPKVPIAVDRVSGVAEAAAIASIYFLDHVAAPADTDLAEVRGSAAVIELLRNSLNVGHSRQAEIDGLCALVGKVEALRLTYSMADDAAQRIDSRAR
jgi:hypothetical protein